MFTLNTHVAIVEGGHELKSTCIFDKESLPNDGNRPDKDVPIMCYNIEGSTAEEVLAKAVGNLAMALASAEVGTQDQERLVARWQELRASLVSRRPPVRETVYQVIDGERTYQDALTADRTDHKPHSVGNYLTMLRHYLSVADTEWTLKAGDAGALNNIRKIAAISVRAMEEHGAPPRN